MKHEYPIAGEVWVTTEERAVRICTVYGRRGTVLLEYLEAKPYKIEIPLETFYGTMLFKTKKRF